MVNSVRKPDITKTKLMPPNQHSAGINFAVSINVDTGREDSILVVYNITLCDMLFAWCGVFYVLFDTNAVLELDIPLPGMFRKKLDKCNPLLASKTFVANLLSSADW